MLTGAYMLMILELNWRNLMLTGAYMLMILHGA